MLPDETPELKADRKKHELPAGHSSGGKDIMEAKIRAKLEELRECLQNDGGDLEVASIQGKTVQLRLKGACGCCPHATMTIKDGIERILREEIDPEIVVERV